MKQPDWTSWIANLKEKGVEMPEFVDKPAFPLIAESAVGTMVTLEGVTIKNLLPLKQTSGGALQGLFVTDGVHEGFVKVWRPERALTSGDVVTVVGRVSEYQGKRSVEVDALKGGGIASEGEPLATVPASAPPSPPTTQVQQPKPQVGKMHVDQYRTNLKRGIEFWRGIFAHEVAAGQLDNAEALVNARTLAISESIALLRGDINNDDLPF